MCRLLAYVGDPILIEDLVCRPEHSLVRQSLDAHEAKTVTNGDGFGVGWYGERRFPGCYREITPAWSDENLAAICAQVRSSLFFAHVRAATGTATSRANCHPFAVGHHLFMHNGQIGGHSRIRRAVETLIPDALYAKRLGTTDSEAIFLAAFAHGLETDPPAAIAATLTRIRALQRQAGIAEPLRLTACLSDGETLWAFRWASDDRPPTLYLGIRPGGHIVVSEPVDGDPSGWRAVPPNSFVSVGRDGTFIAGDLELTELGVTA